MHGLQPESVGDAGGAPEQGVTRLLKENWGTWLRRGVNIVFSSLVVGALTMLTTVQQQTTDDPNWEKAAIPGAVAALGAIVQHLRSKPS